MKELDWRTISSALRTKLKDIYSTLSNRKRNKSKLEEIIKKEFKERKIILKQLTAPWKKIIRKEKLQRIETFKKKIQHLRKKQKELAIKKVTRGAEIFKKTCI